MCCQLSKELLSCLLICDYFRFPGISQPDERFAVYHGRVGGFPRVRRQDGNVASADSCQLQSGVRLWIPRSRCCDVTLETGSVLWVHAYEGTVFSKENLTIDSLHKDDVTTLTCVKCYDKVYLSCNESMQLTRKVTVLQYGSKNIE